MLIYLDESYDNAHNYFLLGALFIPTSIPLHRAFREVKISEGYVFPNGEVKEVKYSQLNSARQLRIAEAGMDLFLKSDGWFACIVVDQRPEFGWSFDYFGRNYESRAIKEARFYKRFSEMLLWKNCRGISDGVLLADRMTRCAGDSFLRLIADEFSVPSTPTSQHPALQMVVEVDTGVETYQLGQIGDLLTGAVLNDLTQPGGTRGRYKRQFTEYVRDCLGVPSLGPDYWQAPPDETHTSHSKFHIWHWQPDQQKEDLLRQ